MTDKKPAPTPASVRKEYEDDLSFKTSIGLFDTVENNENFYIGKQWEGVVSNGLPTPVFNFLKRVVLFLTASITSDNLKLHASPLEGHFDPDGGAALAAQYLDRSFESIFEHNKLPNLLREVVRNAAVDGDGCLFVWFDPDMETTGPVRGGIRTEVVENTRVHFGNPNDRRIERQPYLILSAREQAESVRKRARENGCRDWRAIRPDREEGGRSHALPADDRRVTVLLRLWKENGTVHACECASGVMVREPWDLGIRRYPLTWLCWDYVQDCCHGQGAVTGLIPNQIFVNKLFAMAMISLMTTAYPRIIYDRTRVAKWDARVGAAIGVNGGDMNTVAKVMEPAAVSPQISQFIELAISYTQNLMGATDTALGNVHPENTSAILALQQATRVPLEITRQNLIQMTEDLGRIYLEFMAVCYGVRPVGEEESGLPVWYDFSALRSLPMSLRLDAGASSYWSEVASMQTLDNLLKSGHISALDYLERVPSEYIPEKESLIAALRSGERLLPPGAAPSLLSAMGPRNRG